MIDWRGELPIHAEGVVAGGAARSERPLGRILVVKRNRHVAGVPGTTGLNTPPNFE